MTQNTKIEQRFSVLILNTLDFDSISALLANLLYSKSSKRIISVEDFHKDPLMAEWVSHESSTKFGNLFKEQGSDKSRTHDYYLVYQPIIDRLLDQKYTLKITEIGLGTNNLDTLSNLGAMGIPGASARAFRDFNQNIYFHGADVDKRILFEEERVATSYVDQLDQLTIDELIEISEPDFMIDDGLHAFRANINVLNSFIANLGSSSEKWLAIEDLGFLEQHAKSWILILELLESELNIKSLFIQTRNSHLINLALQ